MARTKKAGRRSTGSAKGPRPAYKDPAAAAAAPRPTTEELLVQAAQAINSLQYEQAKELCFAAVEAANEAESVKDVRDALEVLGTVELELGELGEAREVSSCNRTLDRLAWWLWLRLVFVIAAFPGLDQVRQPAARPFARSAPLPRSTLNT